MIKIHWKCTDRTGIFGREGLCQKIWLSMPWRTHGATLIWHHLMSHHIVSYHETSLDIHIYDKYRPVFYVLRRSVALFVSSSGIWTGCEANDAAATVATAKIAGISWGEGRCGRWSVSWWPVGEGIEIDSHILFWPPFDHLCFDTFVV